MQIKAKIRFSRLVRFANHQITKAMPKSATLLSEKPKRGGAGSKKTPAAIERGLAVAKEGLLCAFVAGAMGVTFETLGLGYNKEDVAGRRGATSI